MAVQDGSLKGTNTIFNKIMIFKGFGGGLGRVLGGVGEGLGRDLGRFGSSNFDFCAHRRCFVRIFRKSTLLKTTSKRLDLGWFFEAKAKKNREKIAFKTNAFLDVVL